MATTYLHSFVFTLIRPIALILKQKCFWNSLVIARLERLISIKTEEYFIILASIMKEGYRMLSLSFYFSTWVNKPKLHQGCALRKISRSPSGSLAFQLGCPALQVGRPNSFNSARSSSISISTLSEAKCQSLRYLFRARNDLSRHQRQRGIALLLKQQQGKTTITQIYFSQAGAAAKNRKNIKFA